jgi:ABC transport system ATP-binding/permease protein
MDQVNMENTCPYRLIYSAENQPPVEHPLDYGEYILGRSAECDIVIQHAEVSRRHLRINILPDDKLWITDLGSANGAQLEGKPLMPRQVTQLAAGQPFQVGPYHLIITPSTPGMPMQAAPTPAVDRQFGVAETRVEVKPVESYAASAPPFPPTEIGESATVEAMPSKPASYPPPAPVPESKVLRLTIQKSGTTQEYVLEDGEWQFGRSQECAIHVDDPFMSRKHGKLSISGQRVSVMDTGSANGVSMKGVRLTPNQYYPLGPGEGFEIGQFIFKIDAIPQSAASGKKSVSGVIRAPSAAAYSVPSTAPAPAPYTAPPVAPARPAAKPVPTPMPVMRDASKPLNLMGLEKVSIGRDAENHIVLNHPMVSRFHAVIERMGTRFRIVDTHSANGVFVNDQQIEKEAWLKENDRIKVGAYEFNFTGSMIQQTAQEGYTIEAVHLKKFVSKTTNLLQDINLYIGQNEFVALVGMSGAGKTTLQDSINGYRPATHGQVLVNGVDLYQNYEMFRNDIGYVPQRDIVHMELTPWMCLDYAGQLRLPADTRKSERESQVKQTLSDLGLLERKDVVINRLSGGQIKRVSIGVELLTRPKLFFLDEPTSGLDPGTEYEMMKLLRRLADQGRTIMIITHATKNVMLCDKVIILARGGYLAFFGAPEDALTYFNNFRTPRERLEKDMEFDDIYRILNDESKGSPKEWGKRFSEEAARRAAAGKERPKRQVDAAKQLTALKGAKTRLHRISAMRQFMILSARNLKIMVQDRVSLGLMLALAPILGIFDLVWGRGIFDPVTGSTQKVVSQFFMTAIIAILVGALSSVREIVKEADIYKRERAVALKVMPYILSKIWIGLVLAIYQGVILLLAKVLLVRPEVYGMPASLGYLTMMVTIILGIINGYMLGLLISAAVPNQNAALIILIAALVPQFLFAGSLLELETMRGGMVISKGVTTRWMFEAFMKATGIGDQVVNDPCWSLPKEERLALTTEQKEQCACLGPNIFTQCGRMPGILTKDYYNDEAQSALEAPEPEKPIEPTRYPSPTSIPSPTALPSPTPYPTPTSLPQSNYSNMNQWMADSQEQTADYYDERSDQLGDYQDEIKDQSGDWAEESSNQMEDYADQTQTQYKDYSKLMEIYGDDFGEWQKLRGSAVGAGENSLSTYMEKWGRAFRGSIIARWFNLCVIALVFFIGILYFQKRKDVI